MLVEHLVFSNNKGSRLYQRSQSLRPAELLEILQIILLCSPLLKGKEILAGGKLEPETLSKWALIFFLEIEWERWGKRGERKFPVSQTQMEEEQDICSSSGQQ